MMRIHLGRKRERLAGLLAALALSACFDSRWFDVQRAKKAAVENATPKELHATPKTTEIGAAEAPITTGSPVETPITTGAPVGAPMRVLKVRARATARYTAEVTDWRRQAASILEDANVIVGPTLKIRLELASAEPWPRSGTDDDLSALGDELVAVDPGKDVEWVIGLVGSVPRFELSFHQLGLAKSMSKHFVMRAMNDARDYEAIGRALSWLGEEERTKLYRTRKRHKTTTVFLHELAHTLGAMHEPDTSAIMHPSYDPKATGYSAATADLLRLTLKHRLSPGEETEQAFAQKRLDLLERTSSSWVATERDATAAHLKAILAAPAPPARTKPAESTKKAAPEADIAELRAPDQGIFREATEALAAGKVLEARDRAKPLFTSYSNVYAVADLRCQIAMKLGGAWEAVQAECAPLLKFVPGQGQPKR